jgi:phage terminase large subunit-like protein
MSSLVAERLGVQTPRLQHLPEGAVSSAATEVVELAESAGLTLDPWQCHVLEHGLAERADGQWAAFEVGLIVSRQNGKGSILEALELAGLFLFDERLILHSAHEFKTAAEAFLRVKALIDNTDDLRRKVARVRTSHGDEGIELRSGARLRFVARSRGSGRGFSADRIILDEAYNLDAAAMAALLPTLSSIPNPQVWYTSSAPMLTSSQLLSVRRRALAGNAGRLAFFEWSIDPKSDDFGDPASWAKANPALGLRITEEFVAAEFDAMREHRQAFARERLGVPDDPDDGDSRLPLSLWRQCADRTSTIDGDPLALAWDVNPERSWSSFAVAGRRADGRLHVEVVDRREGTRWVLARARELHERYGLPVALDPKQAGGLLAELQSAGIPTVELSAADVARACGALVDAVTGRELCHIDQDPLNLAVANAGDRPLGDAWAWSRKSSAVDISPLVAVTFAAFAALSARQEVPSLW